VVTVNKTAAIRTTIAATRDEPLVFTTGYTCRIAHRIADRPNHFYMTGSMGLASSIGIGIAAATGLTTLVVDGDGSLMMNPVGLLVAGGTDGLPLVHLAMIDSQYASTGGQAVLPDPMPLAAWARAAGYRRVEHVATVGALATVLSRALPACRAPVFVYCQLDEPDNDIPGRVAAPLGSHARRFQAHIRRLIDCERGDA
jgi:sulfopyruvate decarboxylase subunit beta